MKIRVEALNSARLSNIAPDEDTARWLAGIDDSLFNKLAAVGLVPKKKDIPTATLKAFLDAYADGRSDVKESTATVYGHTRRNLIDFFGADKPLTEITTGHAKDWRIWLVTTEELADNTVRRRSGIAKQFFNDAVDRKLIEENPFDDLVCAVRKNDKRYYFGNRSSPPSLTGRLSCKDPGLFRSFATEVDDGSHGGLVEAAGVAATAAAV